MNRSRSTRLGFAAAVWLVLSVAVFGTLIGIAWMSMSATADVSTDAIAIDVVDQAGSAVETIPDITPHGVFYSPAENPGAAVGIISGITPHGVYYTPA